MQFPTFTFTLFFLVVLGVWWGLLGEKTSPLVRRAVISRESLTEVGRYLLAAASDGRAGDG